MQNIFQLVTILIVQISVGAEGREFEGGGNEHTLAVAHRALATLRTDFPGPPAARCELRGNSQVPESQKVGFWA